MILNKKKNNNNEDQIIKITDIVLAASLIASGFKIKDIVKEGKYAHFLFENGDEIQNVIKEYYTGDLVLPVKKVFQEYKALKQMKFNIK